MQPQPLYLQAQHLFIKFSVRKNIEVYKLFINRTTLLVVGILRSKMYLEINVNVLMMDFENWISKNQYVEIGIDTAFAAYYAPSIVHPPIITIKPFSFLFIIGYPDRGSYKKQKYN